MSSGPIMIARSDHSSLRASLMVSATTLIGIVASTGRQGQGQ